VLVRSLKLFGCLLFSFDGDVDDDSSNNDVLHFQPDNDDEIFDSCEVTIICFSVCCVHVQVTNMDYAMLSAAVFVVKINNFISHIRLIMLLNGKTVIQIFSNQH